MMRNLHLGTNNKNDSFLFQRIRTHKAFQDSATAAVHWSPEATAAAAAAAAEAAMRGISSSTRSIATMATTTTANYRTTTTTTLAHHTSTTVNGCHHRTLLAALFGVGLVNDVNSDNGVVRLQEDEEESLAQGNTTTTSPHTLFVWDFDWTIVNCNSDEYIPAQFFTDADELNDGFRDAYESTTDNNNKKDWHACVEAMTTRAIQEKGATTQTLLQAARQMPYLMGVMDAVENIHQKSPTTTTGQMILSDGNTLFIGAFLQEHGIVEHFTHGIVSNQGFFLGSNDENGELNHDDYCSTNGGPPPRLCVIHHSKPLGGHTCPRCPPNLCKTQALENSLKQWFVSVTEDGSTSDESSQSSDEWKQRKPRIVYVGDGANDACPLLNVLDVGDVLLARAGKKRSYANRRVGGEGDLEAASSTDTDGHGDEIANEGGVFGILPALDRAASEDGRIVPKCQVEEWRTGDELKHLVQRFLDDI